MRTLAKCILEGLCYGSIFYFIPFWGSALFAWLIVHGPLWRCLAISHLALIGMAVIAAVIWLWEQAWRWAHDAGAEQ